MWLSAGEVTLPGSFLVEVGLQLPTLWPMQALLLHIGESADPVAPPRLTPRTPSPPSTVGLLLVNLPESHS